MQADSRAQSVLFPDLLKRPVQAAFDEPDTTSDGGALLLKALDDRVGLTAALAGAIAANRARSGTLRKLARRAGWSNPRQRLDAWDDNVRAGSREIAARETRVRKTLAAQT